MRFGSLAVRTNNCCIDLGQILFQVNTPYHIYYACAEPHLRLKCRHLLILLRLDVNPE